jgi:hypothetical protein
MTHPLIAFLHDSRFPPKTWYWFAPIKSELHRINPLELLLDMGVSAQNKPYSDSNRPEASKLK